MRFRKGQWHPSVGEVFSGSVSPPPTFRNVILCHSHLPSLMMRGLRGTRCWLLPWGLGHLTPLCNSCLMPPPCEQSLHPCHSQTPLDPRSPTQCNWQCHYIGLPVSHLSLHATWDCINWFPAAGKAPLHLFRRRGENEKKNDKAGKVIWYLRWYPAKNGSEQSRKKYLSTAPSQFPFNGSSSSRTWLFLCSFGRLHFRTNANRGVIYLESIESIHCCIWLLMVKGTL